ncbi:hypothetical protein LDG_6466 [Legionella drancourtii LLAP12]|uniref:Uncharacterized protein n=1 Tax=Legionella drancourtii LLAP12 TaxID=658187 RepID=G9EMJ9_9GAMM|nr:hypothetical protein LDG_6466 [Legionella drancourtii LLAP12]
MTDFLNLMAVGPGRSAIKYCETFKSLFSILNYRYRVSLNYVRIICIINSRSSVLGRVELS